MTMLLRSRLFFLLASAAVMLSTVILPQSVLAQSRNANDSDKDQDEPANILGIPQFKLGTKPLFVVSLASLNRAKEDVEYVFDAAGSPDVVDEIMKRLEDNAGGLAGIDWERPAGMMAYLGSVFPPAFEFVAFLPVSDINDFQRTMELGQVVMRKVPNEEGRYEMIGPTQTTQVRVEQGYAFIQMPFFEPDTTFDRDLPDPAVLAGSLANQFDLAITMDVSAVPKATRDLILNVLNSTMSANMQQRDDEPDSVYEIRRSWMQGDIDALKMLLDELQRMTIGVDIIPEERVANIDMVFEAPEGTKLFQELFESTTKPTYFAPILNEDAPVSLSMSSVISERDRERYSGVFEGLKGELARQIDINNLGAVPDESSPIFDGLTALQETFNEGHLDVFAQCFSDSSDKLVVLGAMRLERGEAVAAGLFDLLNRIQDQDDIGEIQLGYGEHAGITFHRIVFKGNDPGRAEVFGRDAALIFGVGSRSGWACVGGDEAFDTLKAVIDQLTLAYENPQDRQAPASLRLILNVNQLVELQQRAESASRSAEKEELETLRGEVEELAQAPADKVQQRATELGNRRQRFRQRQRRNGEIFRAALAEGDDRIQVDFRPTDTGGRTRIQVQEGFIRGIGRLIAQQFDPSNQ